MNFWEWIDRNWKKLLIVVAIILGILLIIKLVIIGIALEFVKYAFEQAAKY